MLTGFAPLQAFIILVIVAGSVIGLVFWLRWVIGVRESDAKKSSTNEAEHPPKQY